MGRKKLSNSEKVRRYIAANPDAKPKQIAAATGASTYTVYAIKYKEKPKAKAKYHEDVTPLAHDPKNDPKPAADMVNHPPHYTAGGIETIDFLQAKLTREEFVGYLKGNVLKYGSRLGKKGDTDTDAGKMAWYALKLRDTLNNHA